MCADRDEASRVHPVINDEVLQRKRNPVREIQEDGKVLYRFNIRYLDRLGLVFPMADLSDGIYKRLRRAEEKRLSDMPIPKIKVPGFSGRLYDFQKIAVEKIVEGEIDFLNDEMGLGKTFSALAAVRCLDAFPLLWVCPNGSKYTTAEVAEEFFGIEPVVIDATEQSSAERQRLIELRAPMTIVNFEAIRAKPIEDGEGTIIDVELANPALFHYPYSFAVVDEHHRVKNPDAQVSIGFDLLLAEQWLGMSGTPILNRPEEIWTVLNKIYPERYPNYNLFVSELCIYAQGSNVVIGYRPEPMAKLREHLNEITLRRRKDQVLKDLPKVLTVPRVFELNGEQGRLYDKIQEEFELEMEDGTRKSILGYLPQITRLKQACFSPELYGGSKVSAKIVELKEIVRELTDSGEKAIIFSQWSKATRILQRELAEYNPAYVTGEIKKLKDRHAEQQRFTHDPECKLYIGTIDANREAINLGVATYVIFTDKGWTPAGQDQAVGRSAAGGLRGVDIPKGTKVHVIELRAADTIEEWIEGLLKKKKNIFDRMVERDGGKKIERVTVRDIAEIVTRRRGSTKKSKKVAA